MEVKFLGQGYTADKEDTVGALLIKFLSSTDFHSFIGFSAFTTVSAIDCLSLAVIEAKKHFKSLRLILGVDQRGTSEEALQSVIKLEVDSFIFFHVGNTIFHPKIYMFEGEAISKVIIGSSNLTLNGLFSNIESSVLIALNNNDVTDVKFLEEIKQYYQAIFNEDDQNLKPISDVIIKSLVDDGIVPTAIENRLDFARSNVKAKPNLSAKFFPKRKINRPPNRPVRKYSVPNQKQKKSILFENNKSFQYTEPGFHFPQGVHVGHILYSLKVLINNEIENSYLAKKYTKLHQPFSHGKLGDFERKNGYLLKGLMEFGIINDDRILSDISKYVLKPTKLGLSIANIVSPILETAKLDFKTKSSEIPSWEMVFNKKHYVSLLKDFILSSDINFQFWSAFIDQIHSVKLMQSFLLTSNEIEISKTNFIYEGFFKYKPTAEFCKSLGIEAGKTKHSALRRCPLILDLLEIGGFLHQENSFVTLNDEH